MTEGPASTEASRRRWPAVAIAAVVTLAVVAVALLVIGRERGQEPAPPAAAGTAPTTATTAAAGQKPLRGPDTIGDFRRVPQFEERIRQFLGPVAAGEFVESTYLGPDGRTAVHLTATRPSVWAGGPEAWAKLWAFDPLTEQIPPFQRFPRDGLDIRCAQRQDGAACYLALPDLEVVLWGEPSAPRVADLLAEAARKLAG